MTQVVNLPRNPVVNGSKISNIDNKFAKKMKTQFKFERMGMVFFNY